MYIDDLSEKIFNKYKNSDYSLIYYTYESNKFKFIRGENNTENKKKENNKKNKKKQKERKTDWLCLNCQNLNYGFRKNCNRCQIQRKDEFPSIYLEPNQKINGYNNNLILMNNFYRLQQQGINNLNNSNLNNLQNNMMNNNFTYNINKGNNMINNINNNNIIKNQNIKYIDNNNNNNNFYNNNYIDYKK